jgi:hypothetical protein
MKKIFWLSMVTVGLNLTALGAMYNYSSGFQNGGAIPAGSLNGWSDTETVSGFSQNIADVSVSVNLTGSAGAYNGDLYAYITHVSANGSETEMAVLLNRIGVGTSTASGGNGGNAFGNSASGINVTFSSSSSTDIHVAGNGILVNGGTYAPDGRAISPLSPAANFNTPPSVNALTTFTGMDPNGNWTLFIANTVSGGGNFSVVSWGITMDVVPEPVNVALGIFGVCLAGAGVVGRKKGERRGQREDGR